MSRIVYSQTDDKKAMEYYDNGIDNVFKKNYTLAIAYFSDAIKRDSGFIQAYENRGVAKYYLHDHRGAIADFSRVIKSWSGGKDQKSKAFFWRGLVKIDSGQKESGCLDLTKAKKLGYATAYEVIDIYCQ